MIGYKIGCRKERIIFAFCVAGLFFFTQAHRWMNDMVGDDFFNGMSNGQILAYALQDGYFGLVEQMNVNTAVAVILCEYLLGRGDLTCMLRFSSRREYLLSRFIVICVVEVGMAVLFMSVGIGYLIPNFSKNLLSCQSVIFFLSGIGFSALHYIKTAVIYMIFRDLLNRKIIAMLVTVSIFLFLFFIYIDSLLGFIIPANYLPFLDLCIPYELYIGQASFLDAGFIVVRQIGVVLIGVFIWERIWERKDVLELEK